MLQVTKIFRFETAHAINGYAGSCCHIHGHSYVLHVTIVGKNKDDDYLPSTGLLFDFKELKQLVTQSVIHEFDHRLILSDAYLIQHPHIKNAENLFVWKMEPSAENILLYIRNTLQSILPQNILLKKLTIYETGDSYAEWENEN